MTRRSESLCDRVEALGGSYGEDAAGDVMLSEALAERRRAGERGPGEVLSETYSGVADSVPRARHALSHFAEAAGASGERLEAIRLAVSEALTNVVKHAYRPGPGPIFLTGAVASGELWVLVGDDGRGFCAHSDSPGLGLGLAVIAEVSDDFAIVRRSSGGTEVRMRFRLHASEDAPEDHSRGSLASASAPA